MTNPIAGWYADPSNPLQQRLWDGEAWTAQMRAAPPPSPPRTPSPKSLPVNRNIPPDPHWGLTISAFIFAFPLGIIALVFSFICANFATAGKYDMASMYSRYAKNTAIGLLIAAAILALVFILFILAGVAFVHGVASLITTTTLP